MELIYNTIFMTIASVIIPSILSLFLLIFPKEIRENMAAGVGILASIFVVIVALWISHLLLLKLYNSFLIYIMISLAMTFGHIIIKKFIFGQKAVAKETPALGHILTYQWAGYSTSFWIMAIVL